MGLHAGVIDNNSYHIRTQASMKFRVYAYMYIYILYISWDKGDYVGYFGGPGM